jgi:formylglycine-generating enzyme required for sulfatase activity
MFPSFRGGHLVFQPDTESNPLILQIAPGVKVELLPVPEGEFLMGSDRKDELTFDDEKPLHPVFLPEFFLARYPITVAQFSVFLRKVRQQLGLVNRTRLQQPVTQVNWYDVQEFCRWASRATGQNVRLPTEAEWEKAARGTDGRIWPWGNSVSTPRPGNFSLPPVANGNPATPIQNPTGTIEVGSYSPRGDSPYGCADMSGNVWEWTHSLYRPYPYRSDDGRESEKDLGMRVLRGGSFLSNPNRARCTSRLRQPPGNRFSPDLGFRICVSNY